MATDRRKDPLLRVSAAALPSDWCLPPFYPQVKAWEDAFGFGRPEGPMLLRSGCIVADDCNEAPRNCIPKAINCSPEAMRADAEEKLRSLGPDVWPASKKLTLDTYALARNVMSEFGSGTPTEKVSVALVAMNREIGRAFV